MSTQLRQLHQLQHLLSQSEALAAETVTLANAAGDDVLEMLTMAYPADGWSSESREALLRHLNELELTDPVSGSFRVRADLARTVAASVDIARSTLATAATQAALQALRTLMGVGPIAGIEDVIAARLRDTAPGAWDWLWFPGKTLWQDRRRRRRSKQLSGAVADVREHIEQAECVRDVLAAISAQTGAPVGLARTLAELDRYLAAHRGLTVGGAHHGG